MILVRNGFLQPFEHNHTNPIAEHGSFCLFIEAAAVSVRRFDAARFIEVSAFFKKLNGNASSQRHIALAIQ
ncbi:hypothetical protein D3C75_1116840 [compost metagenome]